MQNKLRIPRIESPPRLACHTQEEIAASVEMTQPVITGWQDDFINKCQEHDFIKSADFEVPLYNVWKQHCNRNPQPQPTPRKTDLFPQPRQQQTAPHNAQREYQIEG